MPPLAGAHLEQGRDWSHASGGERAPTLIEGGEVGREPVHPVRELRDGGGGERPGFAVHAVAVGKAAGLEARGVELRRWISGARQRGEREQGDQRPAQGL